MTFKSFVALKHEMFSILPLSSFNLRASYSRVPFTLQNSAAAWGVGEGGPLAMLGVEFAPFN